MQGDELADNRYVPTPTIKEIVRGHEADVLAALDIPWRDGGPHIRCPYHDHADEHPSWRWDERKARAYCTCLDDGVDDIFDIVMKITGDTRVRGATSARSSLPRSRYSDISAHTPTPTPSDRNAHRLREISVSWRQAIGPTPPRYGNIGIWNRTFDGPAV
ncbi:MAG: hypothetical protein IIA72_08840 [Proteobacteria bacterium]|nr:hypothetical protein [Pseudomonadota bacterium]